MLSNFFVANLQILIINIECLSLASLSSLVQYLWVRLEPTRGKLVRDKYSSLLLTFVNYRRKKFYNMGSCPVDPTGQKLEGKLEIE
jgi:hypothetical protein